MRERMEGISYGENPEGFFHVLLMNMRCRFCIFINVYLNGIKMVYQNFHCHFLLTFFSFFQTSPSAFSILVQYLFRPIFIAPIFFPARCCLNQLVTMPLKIFLRLPKTSREQENPYLSSVSQYLTGNWARYIARIFSFQAFSSVSLGFFASR